MPPVLAVPPRRSSAAPFPYVFVLSHLAIGPVLGFSAAASTLHAVVTVGVVLGTAAFSRDLLRITTAAAYLSACDVVWRMTEAVIFWEIGKYGTVAALSLALVRIVRRATRAALPISFVLVLLPSALITLDLAGPSLGRGLISSTLSGALALGVCALYFMQVSVTREELRRVLTGLLGPAVLAGGVTLSAALTASGGIRFVNDSNAETSGGFGPNQVATALSVGALACLIMLLSETRPAARVTEIVLGFWLLGQSAFTFSRGGVYNFGFAAACILIAELRGSSRRFRSLLVVGLLVACGVLISSSLDSISGGTFDQRFGDTSTTHRSQIAEGDLDLWGDHWLTGVGPGVAKFQRQMDRPRESHTEYTRLLAEHGALGLVAIGLLVAMVVEGWRRKRTARDRGIGLALMVWALVGMTHSATRVGAISFAFGLGMVRIAARARAD